MKEVLLIPHERLNVVKEEKTKSRIENELNVKLNFIENSVEIDGEGLEVLKATTIVKAMGRGFSSENAFRLFNEEENLEIINLNFSDKKNQVIRSRLIGTKGKTRNMIEDYSRAAISIYKKTVAIIGTYKQIEIAKEAVVMIIKGSKHTAVYRHLRECKL